LNAEVFSPHDNKTVESTIDNLLTNSNNRVVISESRDGLFEGVYELYLNRLLTNESFREMYNDNNSFVDNFLITDSII
jgi:hypothetical protein